MDNDTGIDQNSGRGWTQTDEYGQVAGLPAAEKSGYILDGWYQGSAKVTESTVFKADADLKAKWTKANPNGPFTVKFGLGYKNAPEAEVPKAQTVAKGNTVDLPDGKKLTSPYTSHEFYAWCLLGDDGKLYPWKETNPVTADMTLYAGWVKKGTAVKDGQALPEATEPSKPAQNPAATVVTDFHDVPANSPFLDSIVWAVKQGITNGKTATTFGPGDPCTRGQIVTFLYRAYVK